MRGLNFHKTHPIISPKAIPAIKMIVRGIQAFNIQGPPKNLPRSIYPISSIAHPNQTLLYNCVELLDEK